MSPDTAVLIGVPRLNDAPWPFVEGLMGLQANCRTAFVQRGPAPVDMARNQIVATFLASDCTHLLMVDSDAVLHPQTLMRLLSWDVPVVSALAFMRRGPCLPTAYRGQSPDDPDAYQTLLDEVQVYASQHKALVTSKPVVLDPRPEDALLEVDRTGCHCVLVRRDVLARIPPPWFVADKAINAREDFYFYGQVQKAGYPVYVDLSCQASHLYGDRLLGFLDFAVWDRVSTYAAPRE